MKTKDLDCNRETDPNGLNSSDPGAKNDSGKDNWSLLPLEVIRGVVRVMTKGAAKYSPNGWKEVPNAIDRYHSAMMRHWVKMSIEKEYIDNGDGGTNEPHWACFLTNAVFLAYFMLKNHKLQDTDHSSTFIQAITKMQMKEID